MISRIHSYLNHSLMALLFCTAIASPVHAEDEPEATQAPEFTHSDESAWINSRPLKIADLKGKVVLLDIWTFGCWNCYRSFPWMNDMEQRLQEQNSDFTVSCH